MKLSPCSLFPRCVAVVIIVATVLSALVLCNEQHQAEAFSLSSPLLSIRPSTYTTTNSRDGHDHSPRNDNNNNNDNSPHRYRTFLSVSRPVVNVNVDRTKAGEKLKTQSTDTDAETPSTLDHGNDNDKRTDAQHDESDIIAKEEFQKGFRIIGFITLLNASLAPVWHVAFQGAVPPPPLFLNAVVSLTAAAALLAGGPFLESSVDETSSGLARPRSSSSNSDNDNESNKWSAQSWRGGMELGLWKGIGTTCHIAGMALTTANHGAFLLQLTTLIVPVMQGLRGEKIPRQIQLAVALALVGIFAFTQDPTGVVTVAASASASEVATAAQHIQTGDALVLGAAFFYSIYDIQTFYWGKRVPRTELVTIKVGFQATLSCILCACAAHDQVVDYLATNPDWSVLVPTVLWSGLIVNALATFLQVGGMQAVGPVRAQTIFASQPIWAASLNYMVLGSVLGVQGVVGGAAFLAALFLAAKTELPKSEASPTGTAVAVLQENE